MSQITLNLNTIYPDKKLQIRLLRSLVVLKQRNEFSTFIDFLNDVAKTIDQLNRVSVSPALQWHQGAAQLLAELQTIIRDAETVGQQVNEQVQASEKHR